jgi:hypothetical protein
MISGPTPPVPPAPLVVVLAELATTELLPTLAPPAPPTAPLDPLDPLDPLASPPELAVDTPPPHAAIQVAALATRADKKSTPCLRIARRPCKLLTMIGARSLPPIASPSTASDATCDG